MAWDFHRGSTESLKLGDISVFEGLSEFTLNAHCKVDLNSADYHVFGMSDSVSDNFIRLYHESSGIVGGDRVPKLFIEMAGGGTIRAEGVDNDSFPFQEWCVFGASFKANQAEGSEVFIGGVRKGYGSTTAYSSGEVFATTTYDSYIGRAAPPDASAAWDGQIGQFAAWNVKLEDYEMAALGRGVSALLIRPSALILFSELAAVQDPDFFWLPGSDTFVDFTHLNTPTAAEAGLTISIPYYEEMEEDLATGTAGGPPTYGPFQYRATCVPSSFRDDQVANAVTYKYKVRARDTSDNVGAFSSVVEGTPSIAVGGPAIVPTDYSRSHRARAQRAHRDPRRF